MMAMNRTRDVHVSNIRLIMDMSIYLRFPLLSGLDIVDSRSCVCYVNM